MASLAEMLVQQVTAAAQTPARLLTVTNLALSPLNSHPARPQSRRSIEDRGRRQGYAAMNPFVTARSLT